MIELSLAGEAFQLQRFNDQPAVDRETAWFDATERDISASGDAPEIQDLREKCGKNRTRLQATLTHDNRKLAQWD